MAIPSEDPNDQMKYTGSKLPNPLTPESKGKSGFTLTELLVVIVIIAVLAAVLVLTVTRMTYLKRYGAAAKEVVPQLREKVIYFQQLKDNEAAIAEIETSTEIPTLISLQEFIDKSSASGGAANDMKDEK